MKKDNLDKKTKGKILVVEDDVCLREILVDTLSTVAGEVFTASNGREALQIVKSGKVDAVLTDIKMPEMTGLQFLAEVRSLLIQTPVVVLTGFGDMAAIKEALRLDATDFLEKPCEQSVIISAMEKALAYGIALRQMDEQLDAFFAQSALPPDEISRMKKAKRITLGMKLNFSAYTNVKKAS